MFHWRPTGRRRPRTAEVTARAGASAPSIPGGFRADVEGLRGLATILVLLYHADLPGLPGGYVGLDMFFVISGFLITGLLLRELDRDGRISLTRFYSRRIRRLLPSALVVLAFTVSVGWLILNPLRRESLALDALAANFHVVNWRFADQQVDYLSRGNEPSALQHFWSLSVEEQFYLVWPLAILLVALVALRYSLLRPALWGLILVGGGALLWHSVNLTSETAGVAYFSTLARGWEFGVGAAVALIPLTRRMPPRWLATTLVAIGVVVLAWCAHSFDEATAFPGPAALLPTVATALVIAAGLWHPNTPLARLIAVGPARWVGRISYSWYLWHWPLLVFAIQLWGPMNPAQKLAVIALSLGPTLLAYRFVEQPLRHAPRLSRTPGATYRFAATASVATAAVSMAAWISVPSIPLSSPAQAVGAEALADTHALQTRADAIRPVPKTAIRDRGQADADGCLIDQLATRSGPCVYGAPRGKDTVVLFGDSHAMQFFAAVDTVAKRRGWRLVVLTKAGCTPADVATYNSQLRRRYSECARWRQHTMTRIARERPRLVIVGNLPTHAPVVGGDQLRGREAATVLRQGLERTLRRLRSSTGANLAVMAGNPRTGRDVRGCVSRSLNNLSRCAFSRTDAYRHTPVNRPAARAVAGAKAIDITPMVCPTSTCPAVIGNVLVYRNTDHLTATYVATLTPWLARQLPPLAPRRR